MAASSLLALIDDIATLLDDVATLSAKAASKSVGIVGDDVAVSAEQMIGTAAAREIPIVWAVAKGSFLNKLFIVPVALALSAFAPFLITPILMFGGAYLCYEGYEKISEGFGRKSHGKVTELEIENLIEYEKTKIKSAIRTDLILSAEIIAIALNSISGASFTSQAISLSIVAVVMTIGVYGAVAAIIKIDDLGFYLMKSSNSFKKEGGRYLVLGAPKLMSVIAIVGTWAMLLVGGGIFVHALFPHELTIKYIGEGFFLTSALAIAVGFLIGGFLEKTIHLKSSFTR